MKIFCNFLGVLCAFCLMFILLVTSVEAVVYWTPGYFEKEYTKYNVAAAVDMEMDDLLDVTDERMAYQKGEREDLHVPTIVGGEEREFFNEREIAHMEDVQGLFLGAIFLRRLCVGIIAASIILLVLAKSDIKHLLPKMICIGTGLFFFLIAALSLIISTDFTKYFIIFHKIFFDNDLCILDPSTDLLINIVPEPFFMDTAFRIAGTFAGSVLAVFFLCIFLLRRQKKHSGM